MKKIIILILITSSALYSQILFQKINNQPMVSDGSYGSGCAWGDYNNDKKLDLIVTSYNDFGSSSYPLLYKNIGSGNFVRVTDNTIVSNSLYHTLACAWGDYNYDGKLDLFISTGFGQYDLLYRNLGNGNFERIMNGPVVNTSGHSGGVNWADYNKDGYLDLLVVQHGYNLLYKGLPGGQFTQITEGPIVTDNGTHRRAAWGDYNNDRYPDLFVCNFDNQTNNLYLNNKNGTFTKITTGEIVNTPNWGSGCSWGDYNNDGWLDLIVTTGGGGPSLLYKNNHNGTFTRVPGGAIGTDSSTGFGCNWGDIDNDGDLDLFIANNYLKKNALYRNEGNDNFIKLNNEVVCQETSSSVGSAFGDYNNDGKLDLFVVNQGYGTSPENDFLYKNIGAQPWYLIIRFHGGGIGVRVKIKIGSYIAIREVSGGLGCSSQDMPWVHFGLGFLANNPSLIDSLIVDWHDGYREVLTNVYPNQEIDFFGVISVQKISSEIPSRFALLQNYPNPFNPSTKIKYSLPKNTTVVFKVFDIRGKEVSTLIDGVEQEAGNYLIDFNASVLSSGVYLYTIQTPEYSETRKMVVIK